MMHIHEQGVFMDLMLRFAAAVYVLVLTRTGVSKCGAE